MFHIGILQLTQNLDDAVHGFKEELKNLHISIEFHYVNADGNIHELPKLAQQLADLPVDLIFACSTPAAQAAKDLAADIPVIFTPVFDPVAAKLVDTIELPGGKLTGMSGMVNAADKVRFINELLPSAKKIGLLYHESDTNALIETENFCNAAAQFSIEKIPFQQQEDLSLLGEKLSPELDALFLPIGKIAEDNFSSIAYYADAFNIPIIASHAPNVSLGALGALCANHAALGKACAKKAKEILLDKKSVGNIPIGITEAPEILLNSFVADSLGITLDDNLAKRAKEIYI